MTRMALKNVGKMVEGVTQWIQEVNGRYMKKRVRQSEQY